MYRWPSFILLINLFSLVAMEDDHDHGSRHHKYSRSEPPASYGAISMQDMCNLGPIPAIRVDDVDIEQQQSLKPNAAVDLSQNPELAQRCEEIITAMQHLRDQVAPEPVVVPMTLKEKIKYYYKNTICEHKGKVTLIIVGGLFCIYLGYYIAATVYGIPEKCGKLEDKANDVMTLLGRVQPFCEQTFEQCQGAGGRCEDTRILLVTVLTMIKNGTLSIATEALNTCNEMMKVCRKLDQYGYKP